MKNTQVARLLAFVTGMVNQQILLQNEYLVAENRILRTHLPARLRLTDPRDPHSPRSANGSDVKPCSKSPASPGPIPSWLGTGN